MGHKRVDYWKYTGNGAYFIGVPTRDLSPTEWRRLSESIQDRLTKLGIYTPVYVNSKKENN